MNRRLFAFLGILLSVLVSVSLFAQGYPLTEVDTLGRKVTIQRMPARIISLAPSNTEILFALGAGDRVVGVTTVCNYPLEAVKKEKVGGFAASTISIERILALKPDFVLSTGSMHKTVIDALGRSGIAVYALEVNSMAELFSELEKLGRMLGNSENAKLLVRSMGERIGRVKDTVDSVPLEKRPRVFWEMYDDPLMTAGKDSFQSEVIEIAGGRNIFSDLPGSWPIVNQEEVIRRNPQVIMGSDDHGDKLSAEQIKRRPGWSGVDAVKNGRIYLIPGDLVGRTGPRLVDAVEDIAKALYPQLYR